MVQMFRRVHVLFISPTCGLLTFWALEGTSGVAKACSKSNGSPASGAQNVCFATSGNLAYSCQDYQPIIVNSTLSYGFAGHGNNAKSTCCKCYKFTWTSGAAVGKSMIVQAINAGGITDTGFDIYVR